MVTFFWGATFVIVKNALEDISPLLFNAVRMGLASAIMIPLSWSALRKAGAKTWLAGCSCRIFSVPRLLVSDFGIAIYDAVEVSVSDRIVGGAGSGNSRHCMAENSE